MDGIGGIVIGNIFKLPANRLPMGYSGDDIAFVVMGINHKITEGQDWTTEISGQLILLNSANTTGESTTLGAYNLDDLLNHSVGGKNFNKSKPGEGITIIDGIEYVSRPPNVAKIVALLSNEYKAPGNGGPIPVKLAPGGNKLKGF